MKKRISASCLCSQIQFDCDVVPIGTYCHCINCQKSHGTPFAAQIPFKPSTLRYIKGQQKITEYQSSEHLYRVFCVQCGSRLFNYTTDREKYGSIALSAIDTPLKVKIKAHVCLSTQAGYFSLTDTLKQYSGFFNLERNET